VILYQSYDEELDADSKFVGSDNGNKAHTTIDDAHEKLWL